MWNYIVTIYENKSFETIHLFLFEIQYCEIERARQVTDEENNFLLGKIVFDDNNQEKKSWACFGQTCSRFLIVFLSQLFVILLIIFGGFWRIHLSNTCDEPTVCVGIL